jgi:Holliday junction DNA helicase RuvB
LSKEVVDETLKLLEIDSKGLTALDRDILETIIHKFKGGPVGLGTISAALSEEVSTIEDINEPYLMRLGFLERTQRGRVATPAAYIHLNLEPPPDNRLL